MSSVEASYGDPETRRRILQATWELIEKRGSSIRLIDAAERAGVSRQALYLHFGDRAGLFGALVDYIDEVFGSEELVSHVLSAPTGVEALERMVRALSAFNSKIDPVAQVLEAAQYQDEALAKAWRSRLHGRRAHSRMIVQRIAGEGRLAEAWTVDAGADLLYTLTMPGPWRELTRELGWTLEQYAENVTRLLRRSLLAE